MDAPVMIGKSPAIRKLRKFVSVAAQTDASVLLLGETGVGKEVAARMIHFESARREKPFLKINCASLSETLIESEMFGHRKGAYTGALVDRPGLIEEADGGTFFFDEIADFPMVLQAKLLSIYEDREVRRLGENRFRKIDVRFIFATNRDLVGDVEKSRFRKDLYYRIRVLAFQIEPLRARKEDIPELIGHFLGEKSRGRFRPLKITPEALEHLASHAFPGNVRELENILERAILFSGDSTIEKKNVHYTEKVMPSENVIIEEVGEECENTEDILKTMLVSYLGNILIEEQKFWETVFKKFIRRDLNRTQMKLLLNLGLMETGGSYKKLLKMYQREVSEKEYKKFMRFISIHQLR